MNDSEVMVSYLDRLMIPLGKDKRMLSSISIYLARYLTDYLDFNEYRKLPKRKIIAIDLGVSNQAMVDCLKQLESFGVIIRDNKYCNHGRFSGSMFILNQNYNNTQYDYYNITYVENL